MELRENPATVLATNPQPKFTFRVCKVSHLKNAAPESTSAEQLHNKIIELAVPLYQWTLNACANYWFVTTEEGSLSFETESTDKSPLFIWKESLQVQNSNTGVTHYLNLVTTRKSEGNGKFKFHQGPEIALHFRFVTPIYKQNTVRSPAPQSISRNILDTERKFHEVQTGCSYRITKKIDFADIRLKHKIGEGSFGIVHLALWRAKKYAVKKIKLVQHMKEEDILKEAKVLTQLRHPAIVSLEGVTTSDDNETMLVMEYMEDGSLEDLLAHDKNALSIEDVIQIALDVAEGLHYLHSHKIIHRDLKSGNVLLYDNKKRAKLSDFGTVRIFGQSSKDTTIVGTVGFMAPEILQELPYNTMVDVYSFGALLYQMLTMKILPVILSDENALTKIKSSISNVPFQQLILSCCKMDPDHRPTIDKCIEELKLWLKKLGRNMATP